MIDEATLAEYVQEALVHLYDHSYLQTHPLGGLLVPSHTTHETRGRALRRLLVDVIEQLKPPREAPRHSAPWRKYTHLVRRYVECVPAEHIAEDLGITTRQARRDHQSAIIAAASILWEQHQRTQAQEPGPEIPNDRGRDAEHGRAHSPATALESAAAKLARETARGPAQVGDVVASALATVQNLASGRGVSLRAELESSPPVVAIARTVLRQALIGLLTYAIERLPGGYVRITSRAAGRGLELRVLGSASSSARRDAGRPASWPEAQPPADNAHPLGASRLLLETQGSRMQVAQDKPDEVEVLVELPAYQPSTVLVVDDDEDVSLLFQRYLGDSFRVLHAAGGAQAVTLSREARPDAIILDVLMPNEDGWELLEHFRQDGTTRNIPIVVCSVLREGALALSLGATRFLPKPVTASVVRAILAELVQHPDTRGETATRTK